MLALTSHYTATNAKHPRYAPGLFCESITHCDQCGHYWLREKVCRRSLLLGSVDAPAARGPPRGTWHMPVTEVVPGDCRRPTVGSGAVQVRYRYRIYPTPGQQQALARAFGCARVVYNDCLVLRDTCRAAGEMLSDTEVQ